MARHIANSEAAGLLCRRMRTPVAILTAALVFACGGPDDTGPGPAAHDTRPPLACLHDADCKRLMVCAHRGFKVGAAENTLAAFADAIAIGADAVEVDVRATLDDVLVILHDPEVTRTTFGSGAVADLTYADVRSLVVRQPDGVDRPDGSFIPTLAEVLALVAGRVWIDVDFKAGSPATLVATLAAANAIEQVVVYKTDPTVQDALRQLEPRLWLMPAAVDAATVTTVAARLPFKIIEIEKDLAANVPLGFVDAAAAVGAKVFLDVLGLPDVAGITGDPSFWLERAQSGLHVMQTDAPDQLMVVLEQNGFR